jgi:hypothetical protein
MAALDIRSWADNRHEDLRVLTERGIGLMRKGEELSEFEAYLEDRQRRTRRSLSAIEKVGTKAALNRCRELARQIQSDLLNKKPEQFLDLLCLADFQVSLERAASVLKQKSRHSPSETRDGES